MARRPLLSGEGRQAVALVAALLLTAAPQGAGAAPQFTQTITLHPGWNAVFLEVQPASSDPAAVFAAAAVESVWTWMPRGTTMEYLQNPGEQDWDVPGWRGFYPGQAAYLSNLYAILANRSYLIKYAGADPFAWSVTGRPSVNTSTWVADSFNLVGFPIDPAGPPSLAAQLAPSAAHRGQAVFRLVADRWEFVDDPAAAPVEPGSAYWVWTAGPSAYRGPMPVDVPGDGLDFGSKLDELAVSVTNDSGADLAVSCTVANPTAPGALVRKSYDPASGLFSWSPLPFTAAIGAGRTARFVIAVRREIISGPDYDAVLVITNDLGTRILVPVSAKRGL